MGGKDEFAPLSSLWFATFALAPGFFLPLEQELGRGLGHRRALGQGGRPVVAKVARLGFLLGGLVALAIICLSPLITSAYFDGDWVMLVALVVAFCAYAPAHIARGICSGSGRFRSYAIVIGSDGVVRVTVCIAVRARSASQRSGLRLPHRPVAAGRHRATSPRRGNCGRTDRPGGDVEGGHPEPRVAVARLGVRRRPAQRRAGARQHPRPTTPRRRRAVTEFALRRAARPHPAVHVPGRAGRAAPPAQPARRVGQLRRVPQRAATAARPRHRRRRRRLPRRPGDRAVRARNGVRRRARRHHPGDARRRAARAT